MTDDWSLIMDDWWLITDDWWLMIDDWWLMSDEWWLMIDDKINTNIIWNGPHIVCPRGDPPQSSITSHHFFAIKNTHIQIVKKNERKQLSPEARKKKDSSAKSLNDIKKSILRFRSTRTMDRIHGSDPWIGSMDQIHGPDPWIRSYNWLFDVILRLSEALVCFRASGANFLRSIFCRFLSL